MADYRENSAARSDSSEVANFAEVTGVDRAQAHEVVAKFKSAGLSSLDAMVQTFFEATDLQQSGGGDGNTVVDVTDANGAAAADRKRQWRRSSNGWMSQTMAAPLQVTAAAATMRPYLRRAAPQAGRVEVSSSINFDEMLRGVNLSIDLTPVDGGLMCRCSISRRRGRPRPAHREEIPTAAAKTATRSPSRSARCLESYRHGQEVTCVCDDDFRRERKCTQFSSVRDCDSNLKCCNKRASVGRRARLAWARERHASWP